MFLASIYIYINRFRFGNTTIAEARRNTANNNDRNEQTKLDDPIACTSVLVAGLGVHQGDHPTAWASVLVTGGGALPGVDLVAREPSELSQRSPKIDKEERTEEEGEEDTELGNWMDNWIDETIRNSQEQEDEEQEEEDLEMIARDVTQRTYLPQLGMYIDELDNGGDTQTEAEIENNMYIWHEQEFERGMQ